MDWVLVDAPCSQTGAIRRNPDMKWVYSDERLWRWVAQQREIFEEALKYVKDDGKIVYATCSLLDEENAQQVRYFCERFGLYLSQPPLHALPQAGAWMASSVQPWNARDCAGGCDFVD